MIDSLFACCLITWSARPGALKANSLPTRQAAAGCGFFPAAMAAVYSGHRVSMTVMAKGAAFRTGRRIKLAGASDGI
jgi:hypothetical protein